MYQQTMKLRKDYHVSAGTQPHTFTVALVNPSRARRTQVLELIDNQRNNTPEAIGGHTEANASDHMPTCTGDIFLSYFGSQTTPVSAKWIVMSQPWLQRTTALDTAPHSHRPGKRPANAKSLTRLPIPDTRLKVAADATVVQLSITWTDKDPILSCVRNLNQRAEMTLVRTS